MNSRAAIRFVLDRFGIEVRRPGPGRVLFRRRSARGPGLYRDTMRGAITRTAELGLDPATVIDVGAASGTHALYEVFPNSAHLLIEPLVEFRTMLDTVAAGLRSTVFTGTAGATVGQAVLNVHPDLNGSSKLKEDEDTDVNGVERVVPQSTLDALCSDAGLTGPFLLKIDTQGAELDVLEGALARVLPATEVAILEVSFHPFFIGGPEVAEVVSFMTQYGFVVYDIFDVQYRPLDGAMSQADFAFVRRDSVLRKFHHYADSEQRQEQNRAFDRLRR